MSMWHCVTVPALKFDLYIYYINVLFSPLTVSFYFSSVAKLRFVNCRTNKQEYEYTQFTPSDATRRNATRQSRRRCVGLADLPGRRRLRSSSSHQLLVPPFRLTTVGRRTSPVAASLLCNSLPSDIQSFPSLPVFR